MATTSSLEGILVIDLTRGEAGALSTMFLCDHGARVVRLIDARLDDDGDGLRGGGYVVWDRAKACTRVDLEQAAAADSTFADWVRAADVLVEDFAPCRRPKYVRHEHLARLNGRIVSCSITAYGLEGRHKDEPAIDDLVLARTGVLAAMPGFRQGPIHTIHPLPSVGAGVMAALGIGAALLAREDTGRGRSVSTSLMAGALLYHPKVLGEKLLPQVFQTHPCGSAPFYSVYACADGNYVQLGCVHPGFIAKAAAVLSMGGVLKDAVYGCGQMPQTEHAEGMLRDMLARVLATRPYAQWAQLFDSNDIPFALARNTEEGLDDPQVLHNGMVLSLTDPREGTVEQMGIPVKMNGTPGVVRGPRRAAEKLAPPLNQDQATGQAGPAVQGDEPLPLAGVRVLEITNLIAGPMAARLLADLGADVIKLEPLTGDISRPIARPYFYSVNFEKRSAAIDTGKPQGKELVCAIASTVDVVLANLRPGATARMGIGLDINPNLIQTHITGYGFTGPYSHRPGIDPLAQALMGLQRAQGGEGNPPSFPAQLAPTDFTTGAMAALGTVLALFARAKGHGPQQVEVNLLDGGILLSSAWFTRYAGRPRRALADRGQHGPSPMHRLYPVSDGWIYVAADDAASRAALAKTVGLADPGPVEHYTPAGCHPLDTAVGRAFTQAFATLSRAEALSSLKAAGVACAPVLPGDSLVFFDDPHTHVNGKAVTRPHAHAGELTVVWQYIAFGGTRPPDGKATPLLGEHNHPVLAEAGLPASDIAALEREGLIKTQAPTG
ncbi:MAG: hypothetical protein GKR94_07640 [Gammaproteobacteria bacterium]|nr:hypothetical protein [Gammaproteobacteria bacterium]